MVNIYALNAVSSLSLSFSLKRLPRRITSVVSRDKLEKRCKMHEDSDRIYEI